MLCNSIDKKEKTLLTLAKTVKVQLLKYVRDQCDIEDTLSSDALMTLFKDQFSRRRFPVLLSVHDLMQLSNMLKEHVAQIAIKERDPLQEICKDIPQWPKDVLFMSKQNPLQKSFYMDARYFKDEDIVLCSETGCPLPAWACPENSRSKLVSVGGSVASKEDSSLFLEGFLCKLDPLEAKTFTQLRDELMRLRSDQSTEDVDKQKAANLERAIHVVEELITVKADPSKFMEGIAERVRGRANVFRYLDRIEKLEAETLLAKKHHAENVANTETQLKQALSTSLDLAAKVPDKLRHCVGDSNIYFKSVMAKMQQTSASASKHKIPEELKTANVPMISYKVADLKKMKVVVDIIKPPFSGMQQMMNISIRKLDGGGAELVASISQAGSQNIIEKIILDTAKLQELKHADKTHTANLGNETGPFLTVLSANFTSLIVKLERGG